MPLKSFEETLKKLGPTGRYNLCQYIWLFLSLFTVVFGILGYVFIGKDVPNSCAPLSEQSLDDILASLGIPVADVVSNTTVINECTIDVTVNTSTSEETTTVQCVDGQDFGPLPYTSVISEFDLVCDRELLARLPQFFFIAMQILGGIVIPIVADKVGRKPLLLVAHAMSLILAISLAFPRSVEFFIIVKAISGVFIEGVLLVSVTMAVELTRVIDRKLALLGLVVSWFVGGLALVALSFGLRLEPWRILQYAIAGVSTIVFVQIFVIEESIRWLLAVGREKEAIALITKAARINNIEPVTVLGTDEPKELEPPTPPVETTPSGDKEPKASTPSGDVGSGVSNAKPGSVGTTPSGDIESGVSNAKPENIGATPSGNIGSGISNAKPENIGATPSGDIGSGVSNAKPENIGTTPSGNIGSGISNAKPENIGAPPSGNIGSGVSNPISGGGLGSAVSHSPFGPLLGASRLVKPGSGSSNEALSPVPAVPESSTSESSPRAHHCCMMGRNKHLLINTFIFIYVWLVVGFAYYALYFTGTVFSSNIYLNFTVNVLSEIPAALVIVFGVDSIGRKKVIYIFLSLAVFFLSSASVITRFAGSRLQSILLPIFGLIGKLGVAGTYFSLFLYTGETYPTTFRLIGLGIASVSSRVGALGAPFLVLLNKQLSWLPTGLITILLIVALIVIVPLPETKGKDLPQTIDDVEKLYEK